MKNAPEKVYLDFNATTPLAPEVVAAMGKALEEPFGNPSSGHWAGQAAREAVETARAQVAHLLHCQPSEVVFTSGGSEANNHALKGAYFAHGTPDSRLVCSSIEHPAVLNPCRFLEWLGASVTYLPVDHTGQVDPGELERALTRRTILVSVMHANNEVGTIQPIAEIAEIAHRNGVLVHTDAAQSVGKIATRVDELGVDLLSLAGHKLYAPKGIGALYIRQGVQLEPLIHGAGHEAGRRAGTENVLQAVGLGAACEAAESWLGMESVRELRDLLWSHLQDRFGQGVVLNGHPTERLPNTLSVSFAGRNANDILNAVPELAASTGSACHSGSVELSPVLRAMGVPPEIGMGAIRFSLGRSTTREEIEYVVSRLPV